MARLVKSRLAPCKTLLKKSLTVIKCNRIISLQEAVQKDEILALLEHEMASAQTMIKHFCQERASLIEKSKERGKEHLIRKIIGDVLALVHQYRQKQNRESKAMEALAHRIAANIADFPDEKSIDNATHHLFENSVHLKIVLPEDFIRASAHALTRVAQYFGDSFEVVSRAEQYPAKLELTMAEQRLSLQIDAKILASAVSSWIMRTTHA